MKSKLVSVGIIAMLTAMPVFAEPSNTENNFPQDEYMQEDTTYVNQATYTNMGVYSGSVTADAEYEWVLLSPVAGEYLPQGETALATCTAGSFCPGATNIHYDDTQDQGITACSTLENGAYPNSANGSSANTDCYRACTTENANIDHASAVTGNDYYGAGVDTCSATQCENGYHLKTVGPDLATAIGNTGGEIYAKINASGTYAEEDHNGYITNNGQAYYGISDNNSFATDYGTGKGIIRGHARCSSQVGTNNNNTWSDPTMFDDLEETAGSYCYCQLDSYTPDGGATQNISTPWVYLQTKNSGTVCANTCASACASNMGSYNNYRFALFNNVTGGSGPAICEANTINITWTGATQADIEANNAGTCTYGGDIRTPVAAAEITGKRFVGWKIVKPNQQQSGQD